MYEEVHFRNGFGIMKLNVQIERSDFFLEKDICCRCWTHMSALQATGDGHTFPLGSKRVEDPAYLHFHLLYTLKDILGGQHNLSGSQERV